MTVKAMTPTERKRAQRERERAALWTPGVALETLTTAALLEALPGLLAGERPGTLAAVLAELGRRGMQLWVLVAGCSRDSHEKLKDRTGRMPEPGGPARWWNTSAGPDHQPPTKQVNQ